MNTKRPDPPDISAAYQALQAGRLPDAERICANILRDDAGHLEAHNCLGVVRQRLGHPEQAAVHFEKVLARDPAFVPAYANLANSLIQLGRSDDAKSVVDRALSLRPTEAIANRALGDLGYKVAAYAEAETFYRRALAAAPADFDSQVGLGMTLRRLGRFEEALACYEAALGLQPNNASVHLNRGNVLGAIGRLDDSIASYREAIRLRPDYARAHQLLASVKQHDSHDAELAAMEALFGRPGIAAADRMNLAFGLGKAFEELRDYDKAFGYFQHGNRAKRSMTPYSSKDDIRFFEQLRSVFDADFFRQHQGMGSDDNSPIFILGMPRSGTTLVEQILASHPEVHGAGELIDLQVACKGAVDLFPEQVPQLSNTAWKELASRYLLGLRRHGTTARHITDKMPQNFQYVGMIAVMLPNAKIIHCRRDPMDTCVSVFKNLFGAEGLQWSYDLDDLGHYYQLYRALMEHWHGVLPDRIFDIHYEDLVEDPERETRRLLNFCEIPFDSACLSYHTSNRAVETASFAQVRQPIYSDSVRLWRRYEKHLGPLAALLRSE